MPATDAAAGSLSCSQIRNSILKSYSHKQVNTYQIPVMRVITYDSVARSGVIQVVGSSRKYAVCCCFDYIKLIAPVGENDVWVHGGHIQVVDQGALLSIRDIPEGLQLCFDFIPHFFIVGNILYCCLALHSDGVLQIGVQLVYQCLSAAKPLCSYDKLELHLLIDRQLFFTEHLMGCCNWTLT